MRIAFNALRSTIMSIPEYANRLNVIGKESQMIGVSTDTLQRYQYAAGLANVSNDALRTSFQMLNKGLGNGTLVTALEKIDSSLARQVRTAGSADAAFRVVAAAMKNEGNVAKRTAVLMAAFGRSGNQLVPMLGDLSEALDAAGSRANIATPEAIAQATIWDDTLTRVRANVQRFGDIIRNSVLR
jgi:hypothetical protein